MNEKMVKALIKQVEVFKKFNEIGVISIQRDYVHLQPEAFEQFIEPISESNFDCEYKKYDHHSKIIDGIKFMCLV